MFRIDVLATGSDANCTLISDGETTVMIDAGMKYFSSVWPFGIAPLELNRISAVLITHDHL